MKPNNIYLIGPMGAGKTTIGKHLAKLLGFQFYDIDQVITESTQVEISWIFEQEGEAGFRRREHNTLKKLSRLSHTVIATGGGCVISPANRKLLKETGLVIYLEVSLKFQMQRIAHSAQQRPLFAKNKSKTQLDQLNQEREPLYKELADFTLSTDNSKPAPLAKKILDYYQKEYSS